MNKTYKYHIHSNLIYLHSCFYESLDSLPVKTAFISGEDDKDSFIRFKLNFKEFGPGRTAKESEVDLHKCFITLAELNESKAMMHKTIDDFLKLELDREKLFLAGRLEDERLQKILDKGRLTHKWVGRIIYAVQNVLLYKES